jgi:uncharacterized protein YkwD
MPFAGSPARALARAGLSLLVLTALSAAPAHASPAARCPGALTPPAAGATGPATAAIACLVNAERARRGLRPLRADGTLRRVARAHVADMVRRSYFSHVTPGGARFADRIRAAGYGAGHWWHAAEALGWGTGPRALPAVVVSEWLASPRHRRIVLDPAYRELGVGVAAAAPRRGLPGATYAVEVGWVR